MYSYYTLLTKREIIVSVASIALMIIFGVIIGGKINDRHNDEVSLYNKSLQVADAETFTYAMSTDVGNAFVKGQLKSVDTVNFDELGKTKYISVDKEKEVYTMHTRTVTHTNGNGTSYTTTEVYYTWDFVGRESKVAKQVEFLGTKFKIEEFQIPNRSYITTIQDNFFSDVRYVYYGVEAIPYDCILFTSLKNDTINNTDFIYTDSTIPDLISSWSVNAGIYIFWVFWLLLTGSLVCLFVFAENRWLE